MATRNTLTPVAAQKPAAATAAVATMSASTDGTRWVLYGVTWSYLGAPTGGKLTIAWGSDSEVYHITAGGPGILSFPIPKRFPPNTEVVITLASGGGAVEGTVYPQAETTN